MKNQYSVEAFFPEAKAHSAEQVCRVVAGNPGLAAKVGYSILKKRDGVKGARIKTVRFTVRLIGKIEDPNKPKREAIDLRCDDCKSEFSRKQIPAKCPLCGARDTVKRAS
jgi:rubrerythrin